jgi:hypothetical protein
MFDPLLIEFWEERKEDLSIYKRPGGCGIASVDLLLFLKTRKGIYNATIVKTGYWAKDGVSKIGGWVKLDNPDYSLTSFTDKEKEEMKLQGLSSMKLLDRKKYVKNNNLEDELKLVPHSWIEYRGLILDPSGFLPDKSGQFDGKMSSKDKSRYIKYNKDVNVIKESFHILSEGVYASYKLSKGSADALVKWIKESEIVDPVDKENLHVTTTYSKIDVDIQPSKMKDIIVSHKKYEIKTYGRALVLELKSDELQEIHKAALEAGASYEWSTYKPHITLSYNAEANENLIPLLFPPTFDITLSHEEVAPLKEEFEMKKYYSFWGVINIKDGTIILPTTKQKNVDKLHSHESLMRSGKYSDYIRFYIDRSDRSSLVFSIEEVRNSDLELLSSLIYKSSKEIDKMLLKDKNKIIKLFDVKEYLYPILDKFTLEIENYNPNFYSFDTIDFEKINQKKILELLSKSIIEEGVPVPTNSVSNMATYSKPMTFKLFRRKIKDNKDVR